MSPFMVRVTGLEPAAGLRCFAAARPGGGFYGGGRRFSLPKKQKQTVPTYGLLFIGPSDWT